MFASSETKAVASEEMTVDGTVSSGNVMPLIIPRCAIAVVFSQPAATKRIGNKMVITGMVKLENKRTPVIGVAALINGLTQCCALTVPCSQRWQRIKINTTTKAEIMQAPVNDHAAKCARSAK